LKIGRGSDFLVARLEAFLARLALAGGAAVESES
jgi:hypothetical protein